jgi:hypothetical protein
MRLFVRCAAAHFSEAQKAEPVRHTSTKIFVLWKSSGPIFSAVHHSSPDSIACQVPH